MRRRVVQAGLRAIATAGSRLRARTISASGRDEIQFELVNNGRTVRGSDLRGRWLLVFFG